MTSDEIAEVLSQHAKWLNDAATGKRANLAGANLAGANLSGANLAYAYLSGANLTNTCVLSVSGSRHLAFLAKPGYIQIGCVLHSFADWTANYAEIGRKNNYTESQIAEYSAIIRLFCEIGQKEETE